MNIEAYNLDSLRKLVRSLQDENKRLKIQLEKADIAYESENIFEEKIENIEEYDPDQGGRIQSKHITEDLAIMLAAPVSFGGRLEQYIGRLNRDYEGKKEVVVYDYIDSHIRVFDKMYIKRLRTYKRTGFQLITNGVLSKQTTNAIYDSGNYTDTFERDIVETEKNIIVSSPELTQNKVERFIYLIKARQEAGVMVTVITTEPQNTRYGATDFYQQMICEMQKNGIHVIVRDEVTEHFAILDDELVWHGGMNLLGEEDAWDNLMRIKSAEVAVELLEITLKNDENIKKV